MSITEKIKQAKTINDLYDCLNEIQKLDRRAELSNNSHGDLYVFNLYCELSIREKQLCIKLF